MKAEWKSASRRLAILPVFAASLAACSAVGPDYVRPPVDVPSAYAAAQAPAGRARALRIAPDWWRVYGDERLDALAARVGLHNQSLKAATARVREAAALLRAAAGANAPRVAAGTFRAGFDNQTDVGVGVSWEPDLWGGVERSVEAHRAATEASAYDLSAARLSMQARTVHGYFALRQHDALIRLLEKTAKIDARWVEIVQNRRAQGIASQGDVARAQARLGTIRSQLAAAKVARAKIEHAIAVLVGRPPAELSIAPAPFDAKVPEVPAGVPSTLLRRRPDIAAAERRMAAASARIGVRVAQKYPSITLTVGLGILHGLFGAPDITAPLYAGGKLDANVAHARAAYDEAIADYRQTVLDAFREVEDNLAAQNILAEAAVIRAAAVKSARESLRVAINQHAAGIAGYRSLVEARAALLESRRARLELRLKRLDASIDLIVALGGGWKGSRKSGRGANGAESGKTQAARSLFQPRSPNSM